MTLTFQELAETIKAREAQSGNYLENSTAMSITALEVLEGFFHQDKLDLDEAIDYAQHLTEGRCIYTGIGYEVDAEYLKAAIEIAKTKRYSRYLCYAHHCQEFDDLPSVCRHRASYWHTMEKANCEICTEEAKEI